jgi:hypothetical protein
MLQGAHAGHSSRTNSYDAAHHFFMESHWITTEAQFIIDSLPNVEFPAVECIVRQLDSIRTILLNLNDPATTPDETEKLLQFVYTLLTPLEAFLVTPPLANANVPHDFLDTRGCPQYILDLDHAHELHQLGNTWNNIASTMGVTRQMLYNHMTQADHCTALKAWTDIINDIIQGHLEAQGVHVPYLRVQENLQRVDQIGVLVRYVIIYFEYWQLSVLPITNLYLEIRWAGIIKHQVYHV